MRQEVMLQAPRQTGATLADLIDRILDKGLVVNADIVVSVVGVELLEIRIRAALASFETAAKYGLEFPSGTRFQDTRLPEWAAEESLLPAGGNGEAPGLAATLAATGRARPRRRVPDATRPRVPDAKRP